MSDPTRSAGLSGSPPSGRIDLPKVSMTETPRRRQSGNQLLDRLPPDEFDRLEPLLQIVSLTLRQIVHQFEADVSHIYFPTTSLMSLLTVLEDDDPVESSTVGHEGLVGLSAAMGVESSPHRVICQMAGDSLRVPLMPFLDAMGRGVGLTRLLHRYVAFTLRSNGQGIACNALHSIEARASRWFLVIHDQTGLDEFPMTHEFLAFMLGVRRQKCHGRRRDAPERRPDRVPPGQDPHSRPAQAGRRRVRMLHHDQGFLHANPRLTRTLGHIHGGSRSQNGVVGKKSSRNVT